MWDGAGKNANVTLLPSLFSRANVWSVLAIIWIFPIAAGAAEIRVAAAANLYHALPEIVTLFEQGTGHRVKLTFGASGNISQQILQGAPFDLFFSANEAYVERLRSKFLTQGNGSVYAIGRLVLFVPRHSMLIPSSDLARLRSSLRTGDLKRIAIANPEHAPYGSAARQALLSAKLWERIKPHLVVGESAAQAAQFALSGAVEAALIPLSSVIHSRFKGQGQYVTVDEALYSPLLQWSVVLKGAGKGATRFFEFMSGAQARVVLQRYGFGLPAKLNVPLPG
ncbi:MAG: molybdate ABC transporter substrate-binding protein [Gammaproteobacteria bacterium]|nr:molybdate ABC transporter substrate-binding protein [Gammaproteobacteria bacterium]